MLFSRYGFVEFDDLRDADDAVYELNGKDLCGERVIVEHARGPRRDGSYGSGRSGYGYRRSGRDKYGPPTRTEYRLIVENLSSRCSWQDLKVWALLTFWDTVGQELSLGKRSFYTGPGTLRKLSQSIGKFSN